MIEQVLQSVIRDPSRNGILRLAHIPENAVWVVTFDISHTQFVSDNSFHRSYMVSEEGNTDICDMLIMALGRILQEYRGWLDRRLSDGVDSIRMTEFYQNIRSYSSLSSGIYTYTTSAY